MSGFSEEGQHSFVASVIPSEVEEEIVVDLPIAGRAGRVAVTAAAAAEEKEGEKDYATRENIVDATNNVHVEDGDNSQNNMDDMESLVMSRVRVTSIVVD